MVARQRGLRDLLGLVGDVYRHLVRQDQHRTSELDPRDAHKSCTWDNTDAQDSKDRAVAAEERMN